MKEWIGGVDWLPGLRVIPASRHYKVHPTMHDLTINDIDGTQYHCTVVSKFRREELMCFDWERMVDLLQQRFHDNHIPVTIKNVIPEPWVLGHLALTRSIRHQHK